MNFMQYRGLPRALATATVAAFGIGLVAMAPGVAQAAVQDAPGAVHLICDGDGTGTFTPGIGTGARAIQGRGSGVLDGCTSPDGTATDIQSGSIVVSGKGTAGCLGPVNGTVNTTVTWYSGPNLTGNVVGTSTTGPTPVNVQLPKPGQMPQLGLGENATFTSDSSRFAGASAQGAGVAFPNPPALCTDFNPVTGMTVAGEVTISG
jgi:hypothetical protein